MEITAEPVPGAVPVWRKKVDAERCYTVRIIRIKRDEGKMMPQPMVISYKLLDLKIDPRFVVRADPVFSSIQSTVSR